MRSFCFAVILGFAFACASEGGESFGDKPDSSSKYQLLNKLNTAVKNNPTDANAVMNRVYWYLDHNYLPELEAEYQRLSKNENTLSLAKVLQAYLAIKDGQLIRARDLFKAASEDELADEYAFLGLSEMYFLGAKNEESMQLANQALRANKFFYRPYFQKGQIYLQLGDTTTAVSSFRTAIDLNSDFYRGFIELGSIYAASSPEIYTEYLESAKSIEPENPEVYFLMAECFRLQDSLGLAKRYYLKSLKVDDSYLASSYNLGTIYLTDFGQYDSAQHYLSLCLKHNPYSVRATFNLALSQVMLGDTLAAVNSFEKVLGLDPSYQAAQIELERLR